MMRMRQFTNQILMGRERLFQLAIIAATVLIGTFLGLMLARSETPTMVLLLPIAVLVACIGFQNPSLLAVVLLGVTWGYISEILVKFHNMPSIAKPLVALLAMVIVLRYFFTKGQHFAYHPLLAWMIAYLIIVCAGLWYAQYPRRTELIIIDFVKEILLCFVIINLVTTERWLVRSLWAMLAVGALIGGLTVYQEITHSYSNNFGGLARSTLAQVTQDEANRARAGGTTSEPNAFGQQMLVLVPFGLWAMLYARTLPARILGGFGGLACLAGAGLSFSRGSYLAIVVMFVLMLLHLRLNLRYLLILPLMYIALSAAPAELRARFGSLNSLLPNSQEQNIESDASIRRRSVEMWMAFYMFADHPVAGVGADNFVPLYPTYIRQFGSNVDDELRNAHSYYLEIAAEHGLVGIVVIGGIFVTTITALREARKRFKQVGNTNMAELMVAMQIAFIGYAVSATFLHGDYTRFLWLQVDLAAAASLIAAHAWRRSLATAQQKVEGLPSGAAAVA